MQDSPKYEMPSRNNFTREQDDLELLRKDTEIELLKKIIKEQKEEIKLLRKQISNKKNKTLRRSKKYRNSPNPSIRNPNNVRNYRQRILDSLKTNPS